MYSRLYRFLNLYNCLSELQFGFRAKHSTSHALVSITEKIHEALDTGNFACGVFIDLQKAFDTVDHSILVSKLEYYGARGIVKQWFSSYLNNRKQFVTMNGYRSSLNIIKFGVPQGSVLGPLLFLIYINDLNVSVKNSMVHHFADDTNLLYINKSLNRVSHLACGGGGDFRKLSGGGLFTLVGGDSKNESYSTLSLYRVL